MITREQLLSRSSAATERRSSLENISAKAGASALIVLGALGLSGCASHAGAEKSSPAASSSSASAEASPSATAEAVGNTLTDEQKADIARHCSAYFQADSEAGQALNQLDDATAQGLYRSIQYDESHGITEANGSCIDVQLDIQDQEAKMKK